MIPQGDLSLTAYLNELLRTNKPEQQNNRFWFPTPESPGKPEDHFPIQTRILKEVNELKDKDKLNPQESTESRKKILERFDRTDTLLTEAEKQAIEYILVDYHDIFARHRMRYWGYWDEHGVQGEINHERRLSCLKPESTTAHPLEKRRNCWIGSNAKVWNHHSTAFLQVCKSHICTKEAQRKITSPCVYQENQQSDCGWLY